MLHLHTVSNPDKYERYVLYSPSQNAYVEQGHWSLSPCIFDAFIYWSIPQARAGRTRYYKNRDYQDEQYQIVNPQLRDLKVMKVVIDQIYMEEIT